MNPTFNIVGLGEVLWDCLPGGKELGGAPANFAYISQKLGANGIILSRVGNDELGNNLLNELKIKNLSTDFIQIDRDNPTGTVQVKLEKGQPSYDIVENVAWDFLALTENWRKIAERADAVCFGSLAQRNEISRKTILELVGLTRGWRIFDVNLRQRYYSTEVLRESMNLAQVIKLNHEELPIVTEILEIKGTTLLNLTRNLLSKFGLKMVCVTRGGHGSLLITEKEVSDFTGVPIEVKDTIGAGDSFTAAMTYGLLRNWGLDKINEFANKVGAFVASKTGAMPDFSNFEQ